jgi:hypothetical protein
MKLVYNNFTIITGVIVAILIIIIIILVLSRRSNENFSQQTKSGDETDENKKLLCTAMLNKFGGVPNRRLSEIRLPNTRMYRNLWNAMNCNKNFDRNYLVKNACEISTDLDYRNIVGCPSIPSRMPSNAIVYNPNNNHSINKSSRFSGDFIIINNDNGNQVGNDRGFDWVFNRTNGVTTFLGGMSPDSNIQRLFPRQDQDTLMFNWANLS